MAPRSGKKGKNKGGRPTAYLPGYAEQARKLCRLGSTDPELADFFGVSHRTISTWKEIHPKFLQAIREGKTLSDAEVAEKLYKRATGYEHPAVKLFLGKDGEIREGHYTERYPPDAASAIFWLKNRQRQKWSDRIEGDNTLEITLGFKRDPERWRTFENSVDLVDARLAGEPQEVKDGMRLLLEDVPENKRAEALEQALEGVRKAVKRGEGERAPSDLAQDVRPLPTGYLSNLDLADEEEVAKVEDAMARVEAHNRKVRQR